MLAILGVYNSSTPYSLGVSITPHFPRLSYKNRSTGQYIAFGLGDVPELGTLATGESYYAWKVENSKDSNVYFVVTRYEIPQTGLTGLGLFDVTETRLLYKEASGISFEQANFNGDETLLNTEVINSSLATRAGSPYTGSPYSCGLVTIGNQVGSILAHTSLRFGDPIRSSVSTGTISGSTISEVDNLSLEAPTSLSLNIAAPSLSSFKKKVRVKTTRSLEEERKGKKKKKKKGKKKKGKKKKKKGKKVKATMVNVSIPQAVWSQAPETAQFVPEITQSGLLLPNIQVTNAKGGKVGEVFNVTATIQMPATFQPGEYSVSYKIVYTVGADEIYSNASEAATIVLAN